MGLEEAKEVCRDRKVWRRMTDRIVCLIKFGPRHTFDAVQKGVWRPRWDYASAVGSCRGCLGVTGPMAPVKWPTTYSVTSLLKH